MTPIVITLSLVIPLPTRQKNFWYGFRYGVEGTVCGFHTRPGISSKCRTFVIFRLFFIFLTFFLQYLDDPPVDPHTDFIWIFARPASLAPECQSVCTQKL